MVKTYKNADGEFITTTSNGNIINNRGEETDEIYNSFYIKHDARKSIREYYWYNTLQGKFIQDTKKPNLYHGKPIIYVKEIIEKEPNNFIVSHFLVYHGYELLAKTTLVAPEYITDVNGANNDEDMRRQARALANELINKKIRIPTKTGLREDELIGTWRYYKIKEPFKTFRKQKRKPVKSQRPKKVIKKICKCKRK
jgi:hypothetical protein